MKKEAKIKNWSVVIHPMYLDYVLVGKVFDHPNQDQMITDTQTTSPILNLDFKKRIVETRNTIYTLVGPNAVGTMGEET